MMQSEKFKTLLVDDEPLALDRLKRLLQVHADLIEIIGTAENGTDAVASIHTSRPDLVFLDIQMPELDGFGVLQELEFQPWIVFCTAYDAYALKAFQAHSIDYLLKPVEPARLDQTVEKLRRLQATAPSTRERAFESQLKAALAALQPEQPGRFQVRVGNRLKFVPTDGIYYFRAADKYVELHCSEGVFLISESLQRVQEQLAPARFVRIHRSVLVNYSKIAEIVQEDNSWCVRLDDPKRTELPVSRAARRRLDLS